MTLGLKGVLFLIAAVLFGVVFVLGFIPAPPTWRVEALAWCLMAIAFVLWVGGK